MESIDSRRTHVGPIKFKDGDADRRLLAQLEAQAKDKVCNDCLSDIWVAWNEGTWQLRCLRGFTPEIVSRKNQIAIIEGKAIRQSTPEIDGLLGGQMTIQRYEQSAPAVVEANAITIMPEQRPMSIEEFDQRQDLVRHVTDRMEEGIHYGRIPGTKDLSLWEPGAEYLRQAFNIQWGYEIIQEIEDFTTHNYYYRFFVFQLLGPGVRGPGWEVSAWSKERGFWCAKTCPKPCDGEHSPQGMEAAMLSHNVRDRGLKRGFVAMIRNVTGTTGYFKQALDVEDSGEGEFATGGGNDHPWLVTCPVHNVDWFKKGKMNEPSHKVGDEWCNQSRALKPLIDKDVKELAENWDKNLLRKWVKDNFGGTWSQLSPKVQLDAIERLKTTVPPGAASSEGESAIDEEPETQAPVIAADPADAPENVDGATGEIDPPNDGQASMTGMAAPEPENEH